MGFRVLGLGFREPYTQTLETLNLTTLTGHLKFLTSRNPLDLNEALQNTRKLVVLPKAEHLRGCVRILLGLRVVWGLGFGVSHRSLNDYEHDSLVLFRLKIYC